MEEGSLQILDRVKATAFIALAAASYFPKNFAIASISNPSVSLYSSIFNSYTFSSEDICTLGISL
jgi:hypothetical protein